MDLFFVAMVVVDKYLDCFCQRLCLDILEVGIQKYLKLIDRLSSIFFNFHFLCFWATERKQVVEILFWLYYLDEREERMFDVHVGQVDFGLVQLF